MRELWQKAWPHLRGALIVVAVFLLLRAWQQRGLLRGPAPDIEAINIVDHAQVSLTKLRGKPVIVHFWASWCGVCRAMEHNVVELDASLPLISVASLSGSDADMQRVAAERGVHFPIVNDPHGALAKRFGVSAFPTTFVLDEDGIIRHAEVGYTTEWGMRVRYWLAGH